MSAVLRFGRRRSATLAALLLVGATIVAGVATAVGLRLGASTSTALAAPRFVDVTEASGLTFTYDGDLEYSVGAGVAAFDCDADGRPELYLAGGAGRAALFHNDATASGGLRFTHVPDPATDLPAVTGAYPLDVDADGLVDLAVLRIGGNVMLRGIGGCRFERANETWGLVEQRFHTMAFSATWEAGQRWPTIAFGNYLDETIEDPRRWCEPNELLRPAPGQPRSWGAPRLLEPGWCTLSVLFSSWDGSGRMDLRVSNDRHYYPQDVGQEQLWRIEPDTRPRLYTAEDGWREVQVEGMGIASQDLTADGLPEVYLTSQAANHLMTLASGRAQPTYADIGLARGTNLAHPVVGEDTAFPSTAWHPEFGDVNNDGLLDLFVSKGNVSAQPDFARQDPSHLLVGQPDGTFTEATEAAGLIRFERGRGAALVDLDMDGRLDLVESFYGDPVRVWRNEGLASADAARTHWLALRLRDTGPNVDAVGAWLEVRSGGATIHREMTIGGGHAGGQLGWLHFGLGRANQATVLVRWPDGSTTGPLTVAADQAGVLDHATGTFLPWTPRS